MKKLLPFLILIMAVLAAFSTSSAQFENPYYLPILERGTTSPTLGGCPIFQEDNIWNRRVDTLPVHPKSAQYINIIGESNYVHTDFGSGVWVGFPIGIPYVIVPQGQPGVSVIFEYDDESDQVPYPIPPNPPIEGDPNDPDGDRHILILKQGECKLYEIFAADQQSDGSWRAGSGAVFDLRSNALREAGLTSADAAGLPILPGLVRYDEVASGEIRHAIRFTARQSPRGMYVWPARHSACNNCNQLAAPFGTRFRLKASFNVNSLPSPEARVIARAMQVYGLILADNGSNWYISGAPDERWDNDVLRELRAIHGSDFEAVNTSGLMIDEDSGQSR